MAKIRVGLSYTRVEHSNKTVGLSKIGRGMAKHENFMAKPEIGGVDTNEAVVN